MPRQSPTAKGPLTAPSGGGSPLALRLLPLAFSVIWVAAVGLTQFDNAQTAAPIALAMAAVITVVPVILAWVLADTFLRLRALQAQKVALQKTIDGLRAAQSRVVLPRQSIAGASNIAPYTQIAMTLTDQAKPRISAFETPTRATTDPEAHLPLELARRIDASRTSLAVEDWLRALHFPNSPNDAEGLRALRLALADHSTAKLIRAAQDVLTLLAKDGIFMDNLLPDRTKFDLWRRFAAGERGGVVAELGAVRDPSCLAITAERMRSDAVFRDAAQHFLGSFSRALVTLEPRATNGDLSALSNTRTARAFMLLGQVAGTFN